MSAKKIILGVVITLVTIVVGGYFYLRSSLPRKEDFANLVEPRISTMQEITVLRVDFNGDADTVIADAYTRLFSAYYKLEGVPKGSSPAPLARYENLANVDFAHTEDLKKIPWKGFAAIQIPDQTNLNDAARAAGATIEKLPYGEVAEIVHFGPYSTEHPTILKLHRFIESRGYKISGLHEEQYYKGPGMFIPVKPEDYITVVRYQISRK